MTAVVVPGRKLLPDGTPPPILVARMEAAVQAWREDSTIRCMVLSGGKMPMNADEIARIRAGGEGADGEPPPASEAEAMQRLAEKLGLDSSVEVVLDTESLNTVENAVNVLQLLRAREGALERLLIITSEFHMPRVRQTFEAIFEGSPFALAFLSSADDALTAEEREREAAVEPAMIECHFELPEEIKEDIRALLREAYEGKNLSTVKDAWQKRHPGQKLDTAKWGFKNFSAAVGTIEGVALEHHLEKKLTNLAFFRDSPAHVAFLQERRRREEEEAAKAQAAAQPQGDRKRPAPEGEETEPKRRRGEDGNAVGTGVARRILAKVARGPCSCVIC